MPSLARIFSGALFALLLVAGCAGGTASIEDTWRSPNARYGELTNVVTLSMSRNVTISRSWEDQLAAQLRKRGVRATPAYAVLSEQDLSDRNRALSALRAAGYNGVVTMRLIGKDTQLQYVPTLDAYWGYWGDAWGGEVIPETVVRMEVNAYSLHGNRLVWSGISKSTNPEDLRQLIGDVTTVVSRELDKEKLIPGAPASTLSSAREANPSQGRRPEPEPEPGSSVATRIAHEPPHVQRGSSAQRSVTILGASSTRTPFPGVPAST